MVKKKRAKKKEMKLPQSLNNLIFYKDFIASLFILQGAFFTAIILGLLMGQFFGLNFFFQGILILCFYTIESAYFFLIYERHLNIYYTVLTYLLIFIFIAKVM